MVAAITARKAVPTRSTCMISLTRTLESRPLWRLRHRRQCRLRKRRHQQRYRAVRGQFDPPLAGCDGPRTLSGHEPVDDHGGRRGFQRFTRAPVQDRTSEAGRRNRPDDQVCHYPPGTSKWNKIEHRLFCHITQTWRGKPLISRETVVELIAVHHDQDRPDGAMRAGYRDYPKGIKVSDEEMDALNIKGDAFHPEWNYTITPRAAI